MTTEITPIKLELSQESNTIQIYVLSDVHIGDSCADLKLLEEVVEKIKTSPDMYVILLGDILNTAITNSKSDIYSETVNTADAQKLALKYLSPIKDKILAMTPGNHENRVWRSVGLDVSLWLAEKLGIEDRYRNNFLVLDITFGKDTNGNPYHLHIAGQHGGYGGGRKLGSAMNALEDIDGIICNADIYIRAHTHSPVRGDRDVFIINEKGNIEKKHKHYFSAPAFLKTGGYGLDKGYRPQNTEPRYLNIRGYSERKDSRLNKYFKVDEIML